MNLKDILVPAIGSNNHTERINWVIQQLQALPDGAKLLDAGAGTQQFKIYCKHLQYVSQDFAAYIPSEKEQGLQNNEWDYGELDIISDITAIPEPDASYDAILCSEVLEHLPHPNWAIQEFSRLLKSGGVLIITAPFCSLTHQAPYFFSTGFSEYYYRHILTENNFTKLEINKNGSYFEFMAQEAKRINSVSKAYTKRGLNLYQKIITTLFIRILNKKSMKDSTSNELLCFGCFVRAIKK